MMRARDTYTPFIDERNLSRVILYDQTTGGDVLSSTLKLLGFLK